MSQRSRSNQSYMRLPSHQKKMNKKLFVTLGQQSQTQADHNLGTQQKQMDYMFGDRSRAISTKNNPQTKPYNNPLKQSQITVTSQASSTSNRFESNNRPPSSGRVINQQMPVILQESSVQDRIRYGNTSMQSTNTSIYQNYQSLQSTYKQTINRPNNTQVLQQPSNFNRQLNTSQKNLFIPETKYQQNQYVPPRVVKVQNNPQKIPPRIDPYTQTQPNFNRNNITTTFTNTSVNLRQQNDQLKKQLNKLQIEIKSSTEKTHYQSEEIKSLKVKLQQQQEKNQSYENCFNPSQKKYLEIQNQRIHFQLFEQKKKTTTLQNTLKQKQIEKQNMMRNIEQQMKKKQLQLKKNMDEMNRISVRKDEELLFRKNQAQNLQLKVNQLQFQCQRKEQLIKVIKQNSQKETRQRYQNKLKELQVKLNKAVERQFKIMIQQ